LHGLEIAILAIIMKMMFKKMLYLRRLYLEHPDGLTDDEVMLLMGGVARSTVCRWRRELGAYAVGRGRYRVDPDDGDIAFARAVEQRHNGKSLGDYAKAGWYIDPTIKEKPS